MLHVVGEDDARVRLLVAGPNHGPLEHRHRLVVAHDRPVARQLQRLGLAADRGEDGLAADPRGGGVEGMGAVGVPTGCLYDGYLTILFPQDADTLSALVVRPENDRELAELRHPDAFAAAMQALPVFAPWTDPQRFEPITDVLPGGGLTNTYRGQLGTDGAAALPGVYWVGDAMCTTNPAAGRGVSLGLTQAHALIGMIAEDGADPAATALRFHAWCDEHIRPWFEDHVYWDATMLRRFAGVDLDLDAKIPSDVICAAAAVDPSILSGALPYTGMMAPPAVLAPFEERAREILRTGWRPSLADGPTRDELAGLVRAATAPVAAGR